jgi:hypothetical protein
MTAFFCERLFFVMHRTLGVARHHRLSAVQPQLRQNRTAPSLILHRLSNDGYFPWLYGYLITS